MAERSFFNEIKEALDEIMSGRRYLISTVEKLRKSLPDVAPHIEKLTNTVDSITNLGNISNEMMGSLTKLNEGINVINTLSSSIQSIKNDIQNISNNVMTMRPILDSIRDYAQRQENGLRGIAQALQDVMGQMGQILAKLG